MRAKSRPPAGTWWRDDGLDIGDAIRRGGDKEGMKRLAFDARFAEEWPRIIETGLRRGPSLP
jgi:hypothetical protein